MNIDELNEELLRVREGLAERSRAQRELERAEQALQTERANLRRLADDLDAESQDVRRLESTSLTGLFFAVIGTRQERLEEERREMLSAKLKYDNARHAVESLERDSEDLRRRAAGKRGLEQRYEELLAEKEALLRAEGGPASTQINQLEEQMAQVRIRERELREAVQAGENAEAGLRKAVEALESAQGWGTWDLLGGGMISSAIKHSRIDEANQAARDTQPLLQRFERELADVGDSLGLSVENGGLTAFADIFIDGLLIDLLVQSRINDSLEAARAMHQRVQSLLARLSQQHSAALREAQQAEAERTHYLER